MESKRTPLLEALNCLAMIHHESEIDPNVNLNSELLEEIKSMAARLYMEVDIELLSRQYAVHEKSDVAGNSEEKFPSTVESTNNSIVHDLSESQFESKLPEDVLEELADESEVLLADESEIASEVASEVELADESEVLLADESEIASEVASEVELANESEVLLADESEIASEVESEVASEIKFGEELPPPSVPNNDPSEIPPPIVQPAEIEQANVYRTVPTDIAPTLFPLEPLSNASNESNTGSNKRDSNSVIAQFPLSRRFEFCNILFGGDMKIMGSCIQEIIDAPDEAGRLEVYGRWYDQKQWRRRDESAGDMHKMIKRILNN